MKIQNDNCTLPNFQARGKTIRFADDIARRVNVCYPRISTSMIDDFVNVQTFRGFRKRLGERINNFREEISDSFDDADNFIGKIMAFIKPVKRYKLGNCGESAQLANIVAKVNGIKNCYIASLKTSSLRNLDHSVLYVENNGKPYVIDSWLGFADYVPNAITRYKNEYKNHFFILKGDKLVFQKLDNDYTDCLNQDFKRSQINKLKKIYPEQVIKKGYI